MIRAIVIDDEEAGIDTLKIFASRNSDRIKIIASTTQAEDGIALIEDYRPDVVFLDISMPKMNGFDLVEQLSFRDFKLVFTTAHQEYAIRAIKQRAFDYLLKPIDEHSFCTCLDELLKNEKPLVSKVESNALIEIQVKDGILFIQQKEIIRLEASRSYTEFYLDHGIKHVASKGIKEFESKLSPNLFYRCHKSHIINLQKVRKFINHDGLFALMSDGSLPLISKLQKDEFLNRLKEIG